MISYCQTSKFEVDLKDYKVIKVIGTGSYSKIYKVKDTKTNEIFAAKVIASKGKKIKKMINREVQIMMKISHPTIIGFKGFSYTNFSGDKEITILMDLMKHGSLEKILIKPPASFNNTTRQIILAGISYGMMILHSNNMFHCDLKPGNILIDDQFHPHIADFGSSKILQSSKSKCESAVYGTSMYMAPEIIIGEDFNSKNDVYSFSIIMYQILTGMRPYPSFDEKKITEFKLLQQVSEENLRPIIPDSIKNPFRKLLQRCWSNDPKERPTFEEIFNRLAYNKENLIFDIFDDENCDEDDDYDEDEQSYYLEGIDQKEFSQYIEFITKSSNSDDSINQLKKTIKSQQKEIEKMQKIIEKNEQSISEQNLQIYKQKMKLKLQKKLIDNHDQQIKENEKQIKKLTDDSENEKQIKKLTDDSENEKQIKKLTDDSENEKQIKKSINVDKKEENDDDDVEKKTIYSLKLSYSDLNSSSLPSLKSSLSKNAVRPPTTPNFNTESKARKKPIKCSPKISTLEKTYDSEEVRIQKIKIPRKKTILKSPKSKSMQQVISEYSLEEAKSESSHGEEPLNEHVGLLNVHLFDVINESDREEEMSEYSQEKKSECSEDEEAIGCFGNEPLRDYFGILNVHLFDVINESDQEEEMSEYSQEKKSEKIGCLLDALNEE